MNRVVRPPFVLKFFSLRKPSPAPRLSRESCRATPFACKILFARKGPVFVSVSLLPPPLLGFQGSLFTAAVADGSRCVRARPSASGAVSRLRVQPAYRERRTFPANAPVPQHDAPVGGGRPRSPLTPPAARCRPRQASSGLPRRLASVQRSTRARQRRATGRACWTRAPRSPRQRDRSTPSRASRPRPKRRPPAS